MPASKPPATSSPSTPRTSRPEDESTLVGAPENYKPLPVPVSASFEESRYQDKGLLGLGGMGEVRQLHDQRIGREVACKTLRLELSQNETLMNRFLREARVQGQLEHPAIVPVYDLATRSDGAPCFIMRRIRGRTLEELLVDSQTSERSSAQRFTRRRLLNAFVEVCLAVHYAHTRGIVHRDLKPSNVMLGDFGEVYVLDWGVAKVLEDSSLSAASMAEEQRTAEGTLVGTPGYLAPEQIMGSQSSVDHRSDVYSLGAMLFEIITGQKLFPGKTTPELLSEALQGTIEARPSVRCVGVSSGLDDVVVKATSMSRSARYQSARELADAVENFLDGEQDQQRSRSLAEQQARAARQALERAEKTEGAAAQEERENAFRQALSSLALAPEESTARAVLTEVLLSAPGTPPPEAAKELEVSREDIHRAGYELIFHGMMAFLLVIPLIAAAGVRSWPPVLLGLSLIVGTAIGSKFLLHTKRFSDDWTLALGFFALLCVALSSCWLGPFVLVPTLLATGLVSFILKTTRRERPVILLTTPLAFLFPMLAEYLGLVPPSFHFTNEGVLLVPRALGLSPTVTIVGLLWTHISTLVLSGITLGHARDELDDARQKLFLHGWHLRKLMSLATKT